MEINDREEIEKFSKFFPPYSDFNFVSLWIWNTNNQTQISQLNNNLIIKLKDYIENKNTISFLGINQVENTLNIIYEFYKNDPNILIKLLPEINFDKKESFIRDKTLILDRDQFDYICSTEELSKLDGQKYHKKRNLFNRFRKNYKYNIKILDLQSSFIKSEIINLNNTWIKNKQQKQKEIDYDEINTVDKIFSIKNFSDVISVGIYVDQKLIGFSVCELLENKYAMLDLLKMDTNYIGISECTMRETAKILFEKGISYLNIEQDLGISGLRESKEKWRPIIYLKKYCIKNK